MLGRKKGGHFELSDPIYTKSCTNELKSRFECGNSTLWLHYTMKNAAQSKHTQVSHQIYPKNTLKRKNHKKVEIAWVMILASDFRFFHTVQTAPSFMSYTKNCAEVSWECYYLTLGPNFLGLKRC